MNFATSTGNAPFERFITFDCTGEACIGVVTAPQRALMPLGVVIVVGGPQYRVGSHRQFVALARALAHEGFASLRFDYRGMGDSSGEMRSFAATADDLNAAIEALTSATQVEHVALWGLCDGASAALMAGTRHPRVTALIAVNPWVRTTATEAAVRLRHYYAKRVFSREFWSKLGSGRLDLRASVREVKHAIAQQSTGVHDGPAGFLARMHEGWTQSRQPMLFVLSGRDLTAREFETWARADRRRSALLASTRCTVHRFKDADHTFSSSALKFAVARLTADWLRSLR